jgi:hypothetical protein
MRANVKWLYAFWRASRALNDPAGQAIAKLDEQALTRLGAHAGNMNADAWFHYLRGAMAILGIEPSLEGVYCDFQFILREGGFTKKQVVWSPNTSTFSVGLYLPEMTRYAFAILKGDGGVAVRLKAAEPIIVKDLIVLVWEVVGEEWKEKVKEAMGLNGGER